MSLTIACACGKQLQIKPEYAGKRIKCPACGRVATVPSVENSPHQKEAQIEPSHQEATNTDAPLEKRQIAPFKALIDNYREEYRNALTAIDVDVMVLIKQGKEMKALMLLRDKLKRIGDIHDTLNVFYSFVYNHRDLLEKFGSERLKQLGHAPLPTCECLKDMRASDVDVEKVVLQQFRMSGFKKTHWFIKDIVLIEIEYMLDALQILVEPEFIPLDDSSGVDESGEERDRYIPPNVKLAVWRRDQGRCVRCGSNEKLEYDHIIPISKGGSNTERNVQLLCETCNREKSDQIV